jgi:hypothetical protein
LLGHSLSLTGLKSTGAGGESNLGKEAEEGYLKRTKNEVRDVLFVQLPGDGGFVHFCRLFPRAVLPHRAFSRHVEGLCRCCRQHDFGDVTIAGSLVEYNISGTITLVWDHTKLLCLQLLSITAEKE